MPPILIGGSLFSQDQPWMGKHLPCVYASNLPLETRGPKKRKSARLATKLMEHLFSVFLLLLTVMESLQTPSGFPTVRIRVTFNGQV